MPSRLLVVAWEYPTSSDFLLAHYRAQIPQFSRFNAFMIALNGTENRVGSRRIGGDEVESLERTFLRLEV